MSLEISGLYKDFGGIRALDGASFKTPPGAITGLIGPNGSGKTTLFNVLTGFLPMDDGRISYKGKRIDGLRPHQVVEQGIVRTFQITRIFPQLTLMQNMLVPTRTNGLGHLLMGTRLDWRVDKAVRLLETIGLRDFSHAPASALSYGQSKLLEMAMSFMIDAEIVLLDEPSAGINLTLQTKLNEWIARENREGKEFVIIEHNMEVIMNLCHHIVVLHNGKTLAEGRPAAIQQNPEVLDAYLGD
jgi:neutral amino acid transport system ATP-binding protein